PARPNGGCEPELNAAPGAVWPGALTTVRRWRSSYTTAMEDWPRLLTDFEPLPGVIKEDYDDFVVEELPLYAASGAGTHTYFLLEKRGLSTMQAVNDMARALGVRRIDIGYAGLKDARAVTRQWMSVEHV